MGLGWRAVVFLGLSVLVQGQGWNDDTSEGSCRQDSCLRQFQTAPNVTAFCASYTRRENTATTGLPLYIAGCRSDPYRISSACSCVSTASPHTTTSPPTCEGITTVTDTETCFVTITAPAQTYTITEKFVQNIPCIKPC